MRRAVVTGVGCVSPIGIGFAAFCEGIRSGASGVRSVSCFDATPYQCRVAAEISEFAADAFMEPREARSLPRVAQLAVAASRLAAVDAALELSSLGARAAIVLGTSSGPIGYLLEQHAIFLERGVRRMHPSSPAYAHNSILASECAIQLGIHGSAFVISSACTSSCDAIGLARVLIGTGVADVVLAGGAEAPLTPSLFASFDRLGILPTHYNSDPTAAARPFSIDREGPVLGEGAAVLVLEAEEHARNRGARPVAVVLGYGATSDAYSHFQHRIDGTYAMAAIDEALRGAGVTGNDLDYINAHGTGTPDNDVYESIVLEKVLGKAVEQIPVSSSKSQFGHLLGAAAAMEVVAVLAGMKLGVAPATLNLAQADPACRLAHVRGPGQPLAIDVALSTSFGFGSRNAALVMGRFDG